MKKSKPLLLMITLTSLPLHPQRSLDYFRYFCANYYQFSGKLSHSLFWYQKLLTPNASVYGFKGYVHLLSQTGNYTKIAQLIPNLDAKMAHDPHIQLIFAHALARVGKTQEHDSRIIALNRKHQFDPQIALEAAQIYIRRKELENAIATIDGYLNKAPRKPQNFIFYFCKAQVHFELNEHDKALEAAAQCTKLHPGFPKGWLLLAMIQEKTGNKKKSLETYQTFISFSSQSPDEVKKQFTQPMMHTKKPPKDTSYINRLLQKAIRLTAQKEYSQALTIVEKLIQRNPDHTQIRLLKVHLLAQLKDINTLVHTLHDWIDNDIENHFWLDTLHRLSRTHIPIPQSIKTLRALEKKHPTSLPINLYLADLYLRENEYGRAYPRLEFALNATQNSELKVSILYQMSIIHYDQQEYTKMVAQLEQGLQLNIPYAPLLNLLAYSYAKMNTNLDKAETLIKQALAIDRNPHFLDTQALILQAKGKDTEALNILEQAALSAPKDSTILRHLGNAQYKKGSHEAAHKTYDQALAAASTEKEREKVQRYIKQSAKVEPVQTARKAILDPNINHKS